MPKHLSNEPLSDTGIGYKAARLLLIIIAAAMPFIVPYMLVMLSGHSIFDVVPYYVGGDAVARYDYVRNLLDNGVLLGYNGYDYVLAKIPSYGSGWGLFWSFPYLAFGKIFGWGLNSPVMANIVFLCLANLIFILLTKCSNKSILFIIAVSCLLFVDIDYSISAMSEPSRYATAIILAGMMYRMAAFETSGFFKYLIVPLTIIYGAATFILLAAFIIPYCIIVISLRSKFLKGCLTLVIFGVSTILIKRANSMFCTPYFQGFNMKKDITAFREGGITAGIRTTLENSLHNLIRFTWGGVTHITYHSGRYFWFVAVCWIMMFAMLFVLLFRKWSSGRDKWILRGTLYIMVIITAGYIVLYNDDMSTLIRGINTALCASVFLLTLMDSKKLAVTYMVLALLWSPFFVKNFIGMCNDDYRILTAEQAEEIEARRAVAAEFIKLDKGADPWNNTVAIKYGGRTTTFAVPSGAGKISMHKVNLNEKARYVMAGSDGDPAEIQAFIDEHLANGHVLLVQNDDFAILEKTG